MLQPPQKPGVKEMQIGYWRSPAATRQFHGRKRGSNLAIRLADIGSSCRPSTASFDVLCHGYGTAIGLNLPWRTCLARRCLVLSIGIRCCW